MNADVRKPRTLNANLHLLSYLAMREGEYPLVRLDALQAHHRTQFLFEERWHLNDTPGYAGLGRAHYVTTADLRNASPHHDDTAVEVDVIACEREQLSEAQSASVEDLECAVRNRVVLDLL